MHGRDRTSVSAFHIFFDSWHVFASRKKELGILQQMLLVFIRSCRSDFTCKPNGRFCTEIQGTKQFTLKETDSHTEGNALTGKYLKEPQTRRSFWKRISINLLLWREIFCPEQRRHCLLFCMVKHLLYSLFIWKYICFKCVLCTWKGIVLKMQYFMYNAITKGKASLCALKKETMKTYRKTLRERNCIWQREVPVKFPFSSPFLFLNWWKCDLMFLLSKVKHNHRI